MPESSTTPTVAPHQPTTLESAFQQGDHYTVVAAAMAHLEADSTSAEAAFYAFRSYAALGLVEAALELLTPGCSPLAELPDFGDVERQLRSVPSDVLTWESLRPRFEANAAKVYKAHPHLEAFDATFRSLAETTAIHRSIDGNLHLARLNDGRLRTWLRGMFDAKKVAAETRPAHKTNLHYCSPYVIANDPFCMLLRRVHDFTKEIFLSFTPRLYLLEADPRAFAAVLWTLESIEALCDERVSVFVGESALDDFADLLRSDKRRIIPDYVTSVPLENGIDLKALEATLQSIAKERVAAVDRVSAENNAYYEDLPAGYWARRYADRAAKPLKILSLTSRFTTVLQYSTRDLADAFESLGHEVIVQIEENDHDAVSPTWSVESVAEHKPDMVFIIDHLRREYPGVFPKNVPFVCWVQDLLPHLMCREAGESIGPLDFYIASDTLQFNGMYGYPERQALASTMVTNNVRYSPERLPHDVLAQYQCDFSFVSNQSSEPSDLEAERRRLLPADRQTSKLLDHLYAELQRRVVEEPHTLCHAMSPVMDQAIESCCVGLPSKKVVEAIIRLYVQPLADLLYRQQTLEWVAHYCERTGRTLHLYGNGWEKHPRFASHARGVAQNGEELRAIYQATAINLQCNTYGAIHPRLLDGLASGGFFLMRRTSTDVMGSALRAFFDAVREYGFEPERSYAKADVPKLAAALSELVSLDGQPAVGDPISLPQGRIDSYRALTLCDYARVAGDVFEDYALVSFDSAERFAELADRFLEDADARVRVAESMRDVVQSRFTYRSLAAALLDLMAERLGESDAA